MYDFDLSISKDTVIINRYNIKNDNHNTRNEFG